MDLNDYILQVQVPTISFSNLLDRVIGGESNASHPFQLLMIDTEGLDCDILWQLPTAEAARLLPPFLIFEFKHCSVVSYYQAKHRLQTLGYTLTQVTENIVASRPLK